MRAGNGLSAIWPMGGLIWLFLAGEPTETTLVGVTVTWLVGLCAYVRLPVYLLEIPLTWWAYFQARKNRATALAWLRRTPVYLDELIFFPLPRLDRLLLLALRADRQAGLQEADFIARSFRQGWAANRARLAFTAETLAGCATPQMIAAAPEELDWLVDEAMVALKQGTAEVVPRLLAIAQGVGTTLAADNVYSRRLGYREALEGLDTLGRRLPSLGRPVGERWGLVVAQWQQVLLDELELVSTRTEGATSENP